MLNNNFEPGLVVKSGKFSGGKTSGSFHEMSKFVDGEQINIANQPSGYNHITINTGEDLVNLFLDIYNYHLYFTSYSEKLERYDILKSVLENKKNLKKDDVFPNAHNVVKTGKYFTDLNLRFQIYLGKIPSSVINTHQAKREIIELEKYFEEREEFTKRYGDDLPINMANYIILDEAQLYFGAREYAKNFSGDNEPLKDFIAFPVKINTRIDLITQSSMMLDVNFRRQASTYKIHKQIFAGLFLKTQVVEVQDPEKVSFTDAEIVSQSIRPNFYKIFGYPKLQYYRTHLISPNLKSIYTPGLYFKVLQSIARNKDAKKDND